MLNSFDQQKLTFAPDQPLDIDIKTKVINFDYVNDKLIVDYEICLKGTDISVRKGIVEYNLTEVTPPQVAAALSATAEAMYRSALFVK